MRSALAYAPRSSAFSSIGAGSAMLYLGALAVTAFAFSNPIVLGGVIVAAVVAGLLAAAARALAFAARWAVGLAVVIIAVNAVTSQRGDTILVRGWELPVLGRIDVSAEALAEGGVLALRIGAVFLIFAVFSACVDPDRLSRLVRPLARHSALTATLITRLVPLAAADAARLGEARRLRGPGAAPVGRPAIARRLVAASLDRAVDVAASLELRGYARGVARRATARAASRHSWRFAAAGMAILVGCGCSLAAGVAGWEAYPVIEMDADLATLAVATLLPALAALPYAGLRGPSWRTIRG